MKKSKYIIWFIFAMALAVVVITYQMNMSSKEDEKEFLTYQELEEKIKENEKENKISLVEDTTGNVTLTITELEGSDEEAEVFYSKVNPRENKLPELMQKYSVEYDFYIKKDYVGSVVSFLFYALLIGIILIVFLPMIKARDLGSTNGKKGIEGIPEIDFDDIGGLTTEVRDEILQTQELLKNPKRAEKLGLKPSKGILLYGPSGTGKTMIAKAIAHSFKANFYSTSGSNFVKLYAGMGASNVRSLFEKAAKNAPSVIFIDEIDAVGKKRNQNADGRENDEREQTLNQILVCLDGVNETKDVFVVAATNRLDILDDALLRPGRFDYKIKIDLPDVDGRKEIFNIHAKGKPLSEEVAESVERIAKSTSGYSGADLESLVQNAAYYAFRENRDEITMEDINYGIDRILIGSSGRKINDEETKKRVAYHEAGHAVVSALLSPNSIRKVTIIPRGQAMGYVAQVPKEGLLTKDELMDHLMMMVAGGVAEKIAFGNHSTGVSDDFKKAKEIIEKMIADWGMGKVELQPSFSKEEKEKMMKKTYENVLEECFDLLEKNKAFFESVTELLLEKETVDGEEIEELKNKS